MNTDHSQFGQDGNSWRRVILTSWFALLCLAMFALLLLEERMRVGGVQGWSSVMAGALALPAMVLAMNTMARTDIAVWQNPQWWVNHRIFRWLHLVSNEGEYAGIGLGAAFIGLWQALSHHAISADEIPFGMGFTLLGIMSAAALVQDSLKPLVMKLEAFFEGILGVGKWAVAVVGSASSSFIGEPGGAHVLGNYFRDRTADDKRVVVSTSLAAGVGAGGALLWFAAPPILIVQDKLTSVGWSLLTLQILVGLPAMLQVATVALRASSNLEDMNPSVVSEGDYSEVNYWALLVFVVLVSAHIFTPTEFMPLVFAFDLAVGMVNVFEQWTITVEEVGSRGVAGIDQHDFGRIFQPVTLAVLLVVLEMIGHISAPAVEFVGSLLIVAGIEGFVLVLLLFLLTAVVSAFADNALASVVLVMIPLNFMTGGEVHIGAAAVLMGALYGGIVLPPSNLPNFAFYRIFEVKTSSDWLEGSLGILPSGIVYIGALMFQWYALQAGWLDWLLPTG